MVDFSNAPKSKDSILLPEQLVARLRPLVGKSFSLTRKVRTDGANLRKIICDLLIDRLEYAIEKDQYQVVSPKGKGLPRILVELIDTYLVTSGISYNLQIWNRAPSSNSPIIRYNGGEAISSLDIRYVLVKVDIESLIIESIVIMTPYYIEKTFGSFGKPTIKQQLLISPAFRTNLVGSSEKVFATEDTKTLIPHLSQSSSVKGCDSDVIPQSGMILPISMIREKVVNRLIGLQLPQADTKTKGQMLEEIVINLLGYQGTAKLVGGYPDVPNQILEVKIQDTQTVDLGRYSPQFKEVIYPHLGVSTRDVRYLIALTNSKTQTIEGVILSSGEQLGNVFTYVSDKSYKCQRTIPMAFFEQFSGDCVFNPLLNDAESLAD